jgi:hypothetical protein
MWSECLFARHLAKLHSGDAKTSPRLAPVVPALLSLVGYPIQKSTFVSLIKASSLFSFTISSNCAKHGYYLHNAKAAVAIHAQYT